jgi:hypothetical protein
MSSKSNHLYASLVQILEDDNIHHLYRSDSGSSGPFFASFTIFPAPKSDFRLPPLPISRHVQHTYYWTNFELQHRAHLASLTYIKAETLSYTFIKKD